MNTYLAIKTWVSLGTGVSAKDPVLSDRRRLPLIARFAGISIELHPQHRIDFGRDTGRGVGVP